MMLNDTVSDDDIAMQVTVSVGAKTMPYPHIRYLIQLLPGWIKYYIAASKNKIAMKGPSGGKNCALSSRTVSNFRFGVGLYWNLMSITPNTNTVIIYSILNFSNILYT